MEWVDDFTLFIHCEDEWPARVAEFLVGLADWYAAHPCVVDEPSAILEALLGAEAFEEGQIHRSSPFSVERDPITGRARYSKNLTTSIVYSDFCRNLAIFAFERYANVDAVFVDHGKEKGKTSD